MNPNAFDPKAAQKQSAFTELASYRRRAAAAEAKVAELQGKVDAKEAGVTLKQYEGLRSTLRDLLVAVENQYLSTKGDKKHVPKDIQAAMEAAQKVVRPNALLPAATIVKVGQIDEAVKALGSVRVEVTNTSFKVSPS